MIFIWLTEGIQHWSTEKIIRQRQSIWELLIDSLCQ